VSRTRVGVNNGQLGVLHVVISYCPGGGERAAIEIATRLCSRFRTVACCLDEPGLWASQLTDRGIDVLALERRPGFHPSLGRRIAEIATERDIQVLHCHQYSPYVYGAIAALLKPGLRVIVTEQGRLSDAPPSRKRRVANAVLGRIPHRVFAVSSDLRLHLIQEGFAPGRVEVLHNSIEPGPLVTPADRASARAALDVPSETYTVGTVARLDPVKDLGTLVRAFAILRRFDPRAFLVIIGDGPERSTLNAIVDEVGVQNFVRFTGHRDDARGLLPAFDVYVNCSITEGTSLTIMEAMAASLPVVATDVGGTPEIVAVGETGQLVPARSAEALAGALRDLASRPERAHAFAAAGRRRVEERFSIDRMVERYAQAYRAATGEIGR
jgi:glycosyltransferase involved in cell wall biosynthesis